MSRGMTRIYCEDKTGVRGSFYYAADEENAKKMMAALSLFHWPPSLGVIVADAGDGYHDGIRMHTFAVFSSIETGTVILSIKLAMTPQSALAMMELFNYNAVLMFPRGCVNIVED